MKSGKEEGKERGREIEGWRKGETDEVREEAIDEERDKGKD